MKNFSIRHCSPLRRTHFQVHGVYKETMLRRGRDCEGGRHVALSNIFVNVFCIKGFFKILLDYCINSRVCNYGKRVVIGPLRIVIIHFLFIF